MDTCPATFDLLDPILLTLGPVDSPLGPLRFDLRWYSLAYIAGLMLGWRYLLYMSARPELWQRPDAVRNKLEAPISKIQIDDFLVWATLGVIVGGRLGFVLFYMPDMIWTRPQDIVLGITDGGMSFHGGLIGVIAATALFSRSSSVKLWVVGDMVAAVAPIGLFFGRLANFINGELWGRPTDLPWGMYFASDPLCVARHPSQLYEASLEGLALLAILTVATWRYRSLSRPGLNTGIFLAFYGTFRILAETVRSPDAYMPDALRGLVTMGMLLSIPLVIAGIFLMVRASRPRVAH